MDTPLVPLLAWGTPDNFGGGSYTRAFTTTTASQTDPFGATGAYLLTRTSASDAYAYKSFTPTRSLTYPIYWVLKQGSGAQSRCTIEQGTAKLDLTVTWSGGVPSVTATAGTALRPLALGNGWHLIRGITTTLAAGVAHLYNTRPDSSGTSGTLYAYLANVVTLELLDEAVCYHQPREGSQWMQGRSGAEDAWVAGTDYYLEGMARWLPAIDADSPGSSSGWWGLAETAGVGVGVQALLRAGWERQSLIYAPQRSTASTCFSGCYLVGPEAGRPDLEPNAQESVRLTLRHPSTDLSIR